MSSHYERGELHEGLYNGNEFHSNQEFHRFSPEEPFKVPSYKKPTPDVETHHSKRDGTAKYKSSNESKVWPKNMVTNDEEFYSFASQLLSVIGRGEYESTDDVPKLSIQLLQLKNAFSVEQLKMFSKALDIRCRRLPLFPEPHENQMTSLIRQCERHLGVAAFNSPSSPPMPWGEEGTVKLPSQTTVGWIP